MRRRFCFMMSFLRGFMTLIFSCSWDLIGMSRNDLEWYQIPRPQMPCSQKRGDWWMSLVILLGRPLPPTLSTEFTYLFFPVCLRVWLWSTGLTYVYIYIYIHDDHWCIYLIMYTYIIHISPHTYPKSYRHRYWWQQRSLEYFRRLTRHCLSGWFGSDLPSLLAASPLGEAFFQKLQINKKMHIGEA